MKPRGLKEVKIVAAVDARSIVGCTGPYLEARSYARLGVGPRTLAAHKPWDARLAVSLRMTVHHPAFETKLFL